MSFGPWWLKVAGAASPRLEPYSPLWAQRCVVTFPETRSRQEFLDPGPRDGPRSAVSCGSDQQVVRLPCRRTGRIHVVDSDQRHPLHPPPARAMLRREVTMPAVLPRPRENRCRDALLGALLPGVGPGHVAAHCPYLQPHPQEPCPTLPRSAPFATACLSLARWSVRAAPRPVGNLLDQCKEVQGTRGGPSALPNQRATPPMAGRSVR